MLSASSALAALSDDSIVFRSRNLIGECVARLNSSDGLTTWVNHYGTYPAGTMGGSYRMAIAIDDSLFCTLPPLSQQYYRLESDGTTQSPTNIVGECADTIIDGNGNLYLLTYFDNIYGPGTPDELMRLYKLSSNGEELWNEPIIFSDEQFIGGNCQMSISNTGQLYISTNMNLYILGDES